VLLAIGCRTPKPNLKPPTTAEALNPPPSETRFDTPTYPKEAFNTRDSTRKIDNDQNFVPAGAKMQGMGGH
jgi:hypothetical protein